MAKQFASKLTDQEFTLARRVSNELGVSISQVVKSFERAKAGDGDARKQNREWISKLSK